MIVYIPIIFVAVPLLALAALRGFQGLAIRRARRIERERTRAEAQALARSIDRVLIDLYAELLVPAGTPCSRRGNDLVWGQASEHPETGWHVALSCGIDEGGTDLLRVTRGGPQGPGLVVRIVPGKPATLAMTDGSPVPEERIPTAALNAIRLHRRLLELKPRTEAAFRPLVRSHLKNAAVGLARDFLRQPPTDAFRDRSGLPNRLRARLLDESFGFWDARIDIYPSGRSDVSIEHAETGIAMTAQFYRGHFELFKPGGRIGDASRGVLPDPEDAHALEELFIRLHTHLRPSPEQPTCASLRQRFYPPPSSRGVFFYRKTPEDAPSRSDSEGLLYSASRFPDRMPRSRPMPPRPFAIIGAGNAATALALVLARHGRPVRLWSIEPDVVADVNRNRRNTKYLAGTELPPHVSATGDMAEALADAHIVVCAVPSHAIVATLQAAAGHLTKDAIVASITKGIDEATLAPISVHAAEALPEALRHRLCVIAGPAVANEIAQGHPAAMVVASADPEAARLVADALSGTHVKAATSMDLHGAGYAMALKNAYAIALGMCDGLKFPMNTKALVITMALEEMARILAAAGAQPQTATSLAGLGDLLVTGLSPHGRNRTYGERLVGATTKDPARLGLGTVEGIAATAAALRLRAKLGADAPLLETVGKCLAKDSGFERPFISLIHDLRLD